MKSYNRIEGYRYFLIETFQDDDLGADRWCHIITIPTDSPLLTQRASLSQGHKSRQEALDLAKKKIDQLGLI